MRTARSGDCSEPRDAPIPVTSPARQDDREVLAGTVERVVFHNPENGFCVLRIRARGHGKVHALVGRVPAINPGDWIEASGKWEHDRSHGHQFQASFVRTSEPKSQVGVEKYLSSGAIPGIGPVYARKLISEFGDRVFDVIQNEPERLQEVQGIGPLRASRILAAWGKQRGIREIMVFLHGHGVGPARANHIYKVYGADALRVMTENPYRLIRDIQGIGFLAADSIALKMEISKDSDVRIRAGISHALDEATGDGHCGLPVDELVNRARRLLEVPTERIETMLGLGISEGQLVEAPIDGRPCVFLPRLDRAERGIASAVGRLLQGPPPWPEIDSGLAVPWVERRLGLTLARSQTEAVRTALRSKVMVITGGPGVGKTTIVQAILRILAAKGIQIALCAPTGRAARRLGETAGEDAKTIHRLLEFDPVRRQFRRDARNPLDCDLLVIDETSMVDVPLMHSLLAALSRPAALLCVGDADQLPSVGPGQVLADFIGSGVLPVARLVEVFRQAAKSRIVTNAHRINRGEMPEMGRPDGESDFYFVEAESPEDALRIIIKMVRNRIPRRFGMDPVRDIQVLCPMNRGAIGTRELNLELQAVLNSQSGESERVERLGWTFARGDKVMQIENDYDKDVYNGDIGTIDRLEVELEVLEVSYDGRPVRYAFKELDALVPAYATTIHKSQGSEYPAVVLPIMYQHFVMLQRNLIYTGITRGQRLVVVVGQPRAVRRAIDTVSKSMRWSRLRELLRCLPSRARQPSADAPNVR